MRTKFILTLLIMTAVASTFCFKEANAGLPGLPAPPTPNVNVSINAFLPAPPGVTVQFYSGRPYYVEQGHRVYLKEKKHDKHHKGHGHKYGHYKQK
jgi:hypothetical protein